MSSTLGLTHLHPLTKNCLSFSSSSSSSSSCSLFFIFLLRSLATNMNMNIHSAMCFSSKRSRKKPKPKSKPKAQKSKARKPKFLSLRDHLAPPPPLLPPSEPTTMQEQENIDVQVACLLEHDNGGPTITDLFAGSSTSNNSSLVVDEAFSPASPSVNWDGMARKALRGREKWVFCKSTVSGTSSSSVSEDLDLFGGGGYSRQGLLLKLDYEEVLTAWSDRGSLFIDGEGPQVVPELRQQFEDDSIISNVFVEVGNGGVWRVPEMEVEKEKQVKEGDRGSREAKVLRYKEKRQNRLFTKRIRYEVRKLNAEKRPRIKGRFVKRVEDM